MDEVLESQAEQLVLFRGPVCVRGIGQIESALMRPQNVYHHEGDDALILAVRPGVGLAESHSFVDGNKRTGAVAMIEFLARAISIDT